MFLIMIASFLFLAMRAYYRIYLPIFFCEEAGRRLGVFCRLTLLGILILENFLLRASVEFIFLFIFVFIILLLFEFLWLYVNEFNVFDNLYLLLGYI